MIGAFIALISFLMLAAVGLTGIPLIPLIVLLFSDAVHLRSMAGRWSASLIGRCADSIRLAPLISAIGVSIVLTNYVAGHPRRAGQTGAADPHRRLFPSRSAPAHVAVSYSSILIIGVITITLMLALFTWLISRTPLGRAQRACEQDQVMASLLGVDVDRTISMTFIIGAALAAVAGLLVTCSITALIDFYIGFVAGIKAVHRRGAGRHQFAARRHAGRAS